MSVVRQLVQLVLSVCSYLVQNCIMLNFRIKLGLFDANFNNISFIYRGGQFPLWRQAENH